MGKRKTPKYYTFEEALAEDLATGRPIKMIEIGKNGMFPKKCAMIAGQLVPLAAASDGAKLIRSGDLIGAVYWIVDSAENWVNTILDGDPKMEDKGLWEDGLKALQNARDLRAALSASNIGQACLSAISLGNLQERVRCRADKYEKKVIHSNKVQKGLGTARKKKASKTTDRRKDITDAVKARMAANKGDSLHSARQYVASQNGISFDAVKRATAAMKPARK